MTDAGVRGLVLAGGDFRVGRVLATSFRLLIGNLGKFILLGMLAASPLLLMLLVAPRRGQPVNLHDFVRPTGSIAILFSLLLVICEAAVIYGAFQAIRGRDFSIGDSIGRGLQRFFPVLGVGVCFAFLFAVGLVLLVIPAFIFLAMFFVAIPACVVEGLGPIRSLGRSRELTRGHRWRVFGLYLVVGLLAGLPRIPIEMIVGSIGGPILAGLIGFLYSATLTAFELLTFVVAYHDLRVAKEGVDIEQMASVFD